MHKEKSQNGISDPFGNASFEDPDKVTGTSKRI
jgi:hypothetical protein